MVNGIQKFSQIVIAAHKRTLSERNWAMDFYCLPFRAPWGGRQASVSFSFFTSLEETLIHSLESWTATFPIVISRYSRSLTASDGGRWGEHQLWRLQDLRFINVSIYNIASIFSAFSYVIRLNHVDEERKSPASHRVTSRWRGEHVEDFKSRAACCLTLFLVWRFTFHRISARHLVDRETQSGASSQNKVCAYSPYEWFRLNVSVWCRRASGRANTTFARGRDPSGWPDRGWHPWAPWRGRHLGTPPVCAVVWTHLTNQWSEKAKRGK